MKIGIVRHNHTLSPEVQRRRLLDDGVDPDRIWDLGKHGQKLSNLVSLASVRKGDEIVICRLALLPEPGRGSHDKMKADMALLLETNATLRELDGNRTWSKRSDLVAMVTDALRQIATGSIGKGRTGRPRKHEFSAADLEWIALQWSSRDFKNNSERVAAVQRRFPKFKIDDYYRNRDAISASTR